MTQVVPIAERELPTQMGAMKAGGAIRAIVPQTMDDAFRLAKMVVAAGLAPKGMDKAESCAVAILHGLEIGLKPMQALQRIAVINGRPTIWGDAALGLVRASGFLEFIHESIEGTGDNLKAVCILKRKGEEKETRDFSVSRAKTAGLWNKEGPWRQYPDRMLQMRARAFALRDVFPDVLGGLYLAEEVQDEPPMRDITPPSPPPAPPPAPAETKQIEQPKEPEPPKIIEQSSASYDDMVADWEARLKDADRNTQEEIFENEIEPVKEHGGIFPPDYNRLIALVKDAA